jgi:hypothetical protein
VGLKKDKKKPQVHLSVNQRLEITEKLKCDISSVAVCTVFVVKKQTMSDIEHKVISPEIFTVLM